MPPTHHYVGLSTGTRAHYLRWGVGDKPVIVLAHATGFLAELWTPIAERLADSFTVIAPDARGHGESDKPQPTDDNYHWQNQFEDHKAFLDALGVRGAFFAGHSAGASAGMYVATQDGGCYSRLVAIEPIIMPGGVKPDEARRAQMAESARRRDVFTDSQEMFDQYRARPLFDRWPDDLLRLYCERGTFQREDGQVQLRCPPNIEGAIFANSGSMDIWSVLPDLAAPTLIVRGEETEPFLSMTAEALATRLPNGRLETVAGARHLVPMEKPDEVAELILSFAG